MFRNSAAVLLRQPPSTKLFSPTFDRQIMSSTTTRGFKALIVTVDKTAEGKKVAKHEVVNVSSLDSLPPQKASEKWKTKLATVKVAYSTLNYKDGLALQGKPGVAKSYPIVPGIDLAGEIVQDPTGRFASGDSVIVTGNYIGQHLNGAYAEMCYVPSEWMLPLPSGVSLAESMLIGTAGFTAMQSIDTLEQAGKLLPQNKDTTQILVVGASGGVGSASIAILKHLGYTNIIASTGRVDEQREKLQAIGASQVIGRIEESTKPLEKELYDVVIDPVGGATTANVLPRLKYHGAIALSGVAAGPNITNCTVFPFILRGVSLLGIDSVQLDHKERQRIWSRMGTDFPKQYFDIFGTQTLGLGDLQTASADILKGQIAGRVLVDISKQDSTTTSNL